MKAKIAMSTMAIAALSSMVVAGCGDPSSANTTNTASGTAAKTTSAKTVNMTLYTSGDVNVQTLWQNDLIPMYQKSHPNVHIRVVYSADGVNDTATQDRITAAEKAKKNSGFDIIDAGFVTNLAQANLLQKLNAKEIPLMSHVDAALLKQSDYEGLPYRASSVVLAYNSDFVKNPPKTLSALLTWIKDNPGKFTYNSPSSGGSGDAFVTNVVRSEMPSAQQPAMVSGQDKSLEKYWTTGLNTLHSLTPDIYRNGFYPNGNNAVLQLLANQSIWIAPVWSDMSLAALAQHQLPASVKLLQLTPPFNGGPADVGVVANSPNKAAADAFLNWLLTPPVQSIVVSEMDGYPGVEWKYMPASVQKKFASISGSFSTGISSFYSNDLHQLWQNQVAGTPSK
ncbi:extracellular solute-binding protein [Alicyclobacillus fodiniaquatilis]|uniref:Extracellular solute-binding protein n=1 Tax=Alicyclobacillus fodiniaquatilis TaxID=1661150 RepID=A0ABW4JK58_9BACL